MTLLSKKSTYTLEIRCKIENLKKCVKLKLQFYNNRNRYQKAESF